jgi:hypothetical protein
MAAAQDLFDGASAEPRTARNRACRASLPANDVPCASGIPANARV